eukprot:1161469-Pelagomonas_calceolata.AAC.19
MASKFQLDALLHLVKRMHSMLGKCTSFSLIDMGSASLPPKPLLGSSLPFLHQMTKRPTVLFLPNTFLFCPYKAE